MAKVIAINTVGQSHIYVCDLNPSLSDGLDAKIGSLASALDGSGFFYKKGKSETDWANLILSVNDNNKHVLPQLNQSKPEIGDFKHSFLKENHGGWFNLDLICDSCLSELQMENANNLGLLKSEILLCQSPSHLINSFVFLGIY